MDKVPGFIKNSIIKNLKLHTLELSFDAIEGNIYNNNITFNKDDWHSVIYSSPLVLQNYYEIEFEITSLNSAESIVIGMLKGNNINTNFKEAMFHTTAFNVHSANYIRTTFDYSRDYVCCVNDKIKIKVHSSDKVEFYLNSRLVLRAELDDKYPWRFILYSGSRNNSVKILNKFASFEPNTHKIQKSDNISNLCSPNKKNLNKVSSRVIDYEYSVKWTPHAKSSSDLLNGKYDLVKKLGFGTFGSVYLANLKNTDLIFAIKVIKLKSDKQVKEVESEVNIINKLDSPYVMKIIEHFRVKNKYCIVCEYVDGIDLLKLMERGKPIKEKDCLKLFFNILVAVSHLHSAQIIHRDLKLENIFVKFKDNREDFDNIEYVKIVDLGLGVSLTDGYAKGFAGTPNYIPPEVFDNKHYDSRFDTFSLGVVLHIMLMYEFPFDGSEIKQISEEVRNKHIDFADKKYKHLSNATKMILHKCLDKIQVRRPTVNDLIQKDFIGQNILGQIKKYAYSYDTQYYKSLNKYKQNNLLSKSIRIMSSKIHIKSTKKLKDIFLRYDTDYNGSLSYDEYLNFISEITDIPNEDDIRKDIFSAIDVNKDCVIKFNELVAVFLDNAKLMDHNLINYIFTVADLDGDKKLSKKELKTFMKTNQVSFNEEDFLNVFNDIDINRDSVITLEEFERGVVKYMKEVYD